MLLPDLSFTLPDLTNTTKYPVVAHAPSCVDAQPAPSTCFPDLINIVRPFAFPTEALGQLSQPLSRLHNLLPIPPSVGTHCPSPRVDLVAANAGKQTGNEPDVGFEIARPENDACLPLFIPKITFPCTAVTGDTPGTVTMVDSVGQANVLHTLTKNDDDKSCSTNIKVSAHVPCVMPTVEVHSYFDLKPADSDPVHPEAGGAYAAAQTQYTLDIINYNTQLTIYNALNAVYLAELALYSAAVTAYAGLYTTYQTSLQTWRVAMEVQPLPDPLPIKPTAPTKPVAPVAPVAPVPPIAPAYSASDLDETGDSKISSLTTGLACHRVIRIGVKASSGAKSGGGFMVGLDCGSVSPFTSVAFATNPVLPLAPLIFPPGAEVPIVDAQGIFGDACTLLDFTKLKIVNNTPRCLVFGDIVSVAYTKQTPSPAGTAISPITNTSIAVGERTMVAITGT